MHEMIGRRTSFEAVLDGFDSDAPPQWRLKGCSLPYGRLQGFIEATTAELPKQQAVHSGQTDFFSELRREVLLIDRCMHPGSIYQILSALCSKCRARQGLLRGALPLPAPGCGYSRQFVLQVCRLGGAAYLEGV